MRVFSLLGLCILFSCQIFAVNDTCESIIKDCKQSVFLDKELDCKECSDCCKEYIDCVFEFNCNDITTYKVCEALCEHIESEQKKSSISKPLLIAIIVVVVLFGTPTSALLLMLYLKQLE